MNANILAPQNFSQAMEFAKMVATSSFCPLSMKGKPGDIIVAMTMGAEVGLSPMQSIQNIAVINGKPCLWGDGALGVVLGSPHYVTHNEWFEGSIKEGNRIAYCSITRKGSEEYIRSFSMDDAKKAKLWDKAGVWQNYPDRMLQMRARGFAIRDKFADSLRGINLAEEVSDYEVVNKSKNITPKDNIAKNDTVQIDNDTGEIVQPNVLHMSALMDSMSLMDIAPDKDLLKEIYVKAYKKFNHIPEYRDKLLECKDKNIQRIDLLEEEIEVIPSEEIKPAFVADEKLLSEDAF